MNHFKMKKVSVPISKDIPPPLLLAKSLCSPSKFSRVIPNINTGRALSSGTSPNKPANLCLLQTSDGKKILLTSVVGTLKSNHGVAPFTHLPNAGPLEATTSKAKVTNVQNHEIQVCDKVAIAMPPDSGKHPDSFQPSAQRHIVPPQQNASVSPEDRGKLSHSVGSKLADLVTPAPLLLSPVVSTSTGSVYINNGYSRFKVIGKPIPVTLNKNSITSSKLKALTKLAPQEQLRVEVPVKKLCSIQQLGPLNKTLPLDKQKKDSTESVVEPLKAPDGSIVNPGGLSKPPAYLNIQIKEEPNEETETNVKAEIEGSMPLIEGKVKEEASEDQDALLANDEQLRDFLTVATQDKEADAPSRFVMRTPLGNLIYLSSAEAKIIGLDCKDTFLDNQRKIYAFYKNNNKKMPSEPGKVKLIPRNADIKDYISCNIPKEVKQAAAASKLLKLKPIPLGKEGLTSENVLGPTNVNVEKYDSYSANTEMSELVQIKYKAVNPVIIDEFFQGDQRFMRIKIESEISGKGICDIPIYPLNNFKCPYCNKFYRTKDHIISHIRIHTGERPYPCDVCGKRYRQRIDIIRHMRIHTGERPFTCGMCNASFNQKTNLRSHMRIHTGERPVQCKVCGKAFSRNTHLKQHLKVHTGEKPYKCKECGRMFRFKSGLQAHERIHSGVKPYACGVCGRGFTQIVGLIRHERTHTGEKPFRCINCGKSFNDLESLQLHSKKHTDDRPHTCELCKKTFIEPASLRSHIKKYHNNTLFCGICHREDFKSRIDLREHMREHERENWKETEDGDLVPSLVSRGNGYVSLDDDIDESDNAILGIDTNLVEPDQVGNEMEQTNELSVVYPEEIQVEVELDPDNPLDFDDGDDSEYEEHNLLMESDDPLAC
ncbi:uncharacterized protein [Palaemon carinicauda]|uniref:uncharacterized protein n=1 Tax=Palaemon carinicauda TaxID=392227 RepID=UPI0035B5E686